MAQRAPIADPDPAIGLAPERSERRPGPPRDSQLFRRFRAGDMETRAALRAVCDGLRRQGLGDDDLSSAELILAEALNNIVEHAYAYGEGWVELEIDLRRDGMACLIRDHGRSMPGNAPPDPEPLHVEPPDHLPEGGFGWHIIRCLTTGLSYRREEGWNALRFVMPLSGTD